jgi:hypothetical protein
MSHSTARPMDQGTIRQLAEQLAHWGESLIARGRSPLRKIETFPSLLTACGPQSPPLVFWINRDSFMAGGLVLFPAADDPHTLETGLCCAQALGLRYFVTWTTDGITFWDAQPPTPAAGKKLKVGKTGKPTAGDFQEALQRLMEEIKIMSVLGAVPPPELSAHYLANLCRTTLLAVRPLLTDAYRIARSEGNLTGEAPAAEVLAASKAIVTLGRLLSLTLWRPSAAVAQPCDLEQVLTASLALLPSELAGVLATDEQEQPLPADAAVRFHLFFRRLAQLQAATDQSRHCRALSLLLEHESPRLGGFPLPFPLDPERQPALLLNPDRLYSKTGRPIEIAPRPILVMTALLRRLQNAPPAAGQAASLWQAAPFSAPHLISGTLAARRPPESAQRHSWKALLRTSWPTRRFALPLRTPAWAWEFLHLLGLAAEGAVIELRLSDRWLTSEFGRPLIELIKEQCTLDELVADRDGWLCLRLFKELRPGHVTVFRRDDGTDRQLSWQTLRAAHPALLTLARALPDELFSLLDEGRLTLPADEQWEPGRAKALYLYTRSTLGRLLWQITSGGRSLPRRQNLHRDLLRAGLPVPGAAALDLLQQLADSAGDALPSIREIDREVERWLGNSVSLADLAMSSGSRPDLAYPRPPADDRTGLAEEIAGTIFVDGLPRFPEHYLFDYYRPDLVEYVFDPPLSLAGQFFDTVELRDRRGRIIRVEGQDTARALQLAAAAAAGSLQVKLPADREILAAILERYLADLETLRQALLRETHRRLADPTAAATLAEEIWAGHGLPPWSLVVEDRR